jgi:hypothetical protein
VCFACSRFLIRDANNNMVPEKSCEDLGTLPDPLCGTAEESGYDPLPGFPGAAAGTSPSALERNPRRPGRFRLAHGAATLARPVFE